MAGLEAARLAFELVDPRVSFDVAVTDGDRVQPGQVLVSISGPAASILTAERVALNFLMRLSGVATLTSRFVEAVAGYKARIVDTRKNHAGHARPGKGGRASRRWKQPPFRLV